MNTGGPVGMLSVVGVGGIEKFPESFHKDAKGRKESPANVGREAFEG
jgi:hypothetical protein